MKELLRLKIAKESKCDEPWFLVIEKWEGHERAGNPVYETSLWYSETIKSTLTSEDWDTQARAILRICDRIQGLWSHPRWIKPLIINIAFDSIEFDLILALGEAAERRGKSRQFIDKSKRKYTNINRKE